MNQANRPPPVQGRWDSPTGPPSPPGGPAQPRLPPARDAAGNTVQYIIHRLCELDTGRAASRQLRARTGGTNTGGSQAAGGIAPIGNNRVYYRVTTRIAGRATPSPTSRPSLPCSPQRVSRGACHDHQHPHHPLRSPCCSLLILAAAAGLAAPTQLANCADLRRLVGRDRAEHPVRPRRLGQHGLGLPARLGRPRGRPPPVEERRLQRPRLQPGSHLSGAEVLRRQRCARHDDLPQPDLGHHHRLDSSVKDDGYGIQSAGRSNLIGNAYYYTTVAGEYCTNQSMKTCVAATAPSATYPVAARLALVPDGRRCRRRDARQRRLPGDADRPQPGATGDADQHPVQLPADAGAARQRPHHQRQQHDLGQQHHRRWPADPLGGNAGDQQPDGARRPTSRAPSTPAASPSVSPCQVVGLPRRRRRRHRDDQRAGRHHRDPGAHPDWNDDADGDRFRSAGEQSRSRREPADGHHPHRHPAGQGGDAQRLRRRHRAPTPRK
jgi:hypothetical protein